MSASGFNPPDKNVTFQKYSIKQPLYEQLIGEVCFTINKALKESNIEVSNIEIESNILTVFTKKLLESKFRVTHSKRLKT